MTAAPPGSHRRPGPPGRHQLSLNQATVKHLDLAQSVDLCVRHQIPAIGLWRDRVAEAGLSRSAALVRRAGLHVSSLCRGGFFTHPDPRPGPVALADNRRAIAEAADLQADALILVAGGLPSGSRDLALARRMAADAIAELVPTAQRLGVRLGIEALHPMFCADRVRRVPARRRARPGPAVPGRDGGSGGGHLPRLVGPAAGHAG